MAKSILIDQIHVTVFVPDHLPKVETDAVVRTLRGPRFEHRLDRAIRGVFQQFPSLAKARVTVSR